MARSVSWGRVLFAALLASIITFVLMNATVYVFSYGGFTGDNLALVAEFAGGPGAALAFFCVVLYRARHAALGAAELPEAHAVAAGILSALSLQLIFALLAPPVYVSETLLYLALGLAAGALASRLVRRRLVSRSLLYRASAQMREHPTPDAIASLVGRAMFRSRPDSVVLWGRPHPTAGSAPGPLLPRGAWVSPASPPLPVGDVGCCADALNEALEANGGAWTIVNVRRTDACNGWQARGVRQILVVALRDTPAPPGVSGPAPDQRGDPEGAPAGLLTVGLRARGHVPTSSRDDYIFLAQQAAGVLETARLLQNARDEAKRISDHENRTRLAQELHDTIKNRWLGVGMLAEAGLAAIPADPRFDGLGEKLRLIRQEVENAQRQQRGIIARMRSPEDAPAEVGPLVADLEARAEWWSEASGVNLSFAAVGVPYSLPRDAARHLKPILEEALANVASHARATAVRVTLANVDRVESGKAAAAGLPSGSARVLVLTVADDGVGGAPTDEVSTSGSGLNGMCARARELGGGMSVDSPPGRGTTITVTVPGVPPGPPAAEPNGGGTR